MAVGVVPIGVVGQVTVESYLSIDVLYLIGFALIIAWLFTSASGTLAKPLFIAGNAVLAYALVGGMIGLPMFFDPIRIAV